jgi:acyl-coenzyme A synthetase/AMP-(fatty) acid ligase
MGYLIFVGRCLDRFVINNNVISPAMLDQILTTHPAVKLGVFYGVLNAKNTHDIHACVELSNPKKSVSANSLKKWMTSFIPSNIPVQIHFVSHIPQTSMGKVQRYKLESMIKNGAKL